MERARLCTLQSLKSFRIWTNRSCLSGLGMACHGFNTWKIKECPRKNSSTRKRVSTAVCSITALLIEEDGKLERRVCPQAAPLTHLHGFISELQRHIYGKYNLRLPHPKLRKTFALSTVHLLLFFLPSIPHFLLLIATLSLLCGLVLPYLL